MANELNILRGAEVNLPLLAQAEFAFCTDTNNLYIGTGAKNLLVNVPYLESVIANDISNVIFTLTDKSSFITSFAHTHPEYLFVTDSRIANWNTAYNWNVPLNYIPYIGATASVDLGVNNFIINTNQLYVDTSSGNIGIGKTNPIVKLDIDGNVNIYNSTGYAIGIGGASVNYTFDASKGDYLEILTSGVESTSIIIDGTGNVGIGVIPPSIYKLYVDGNNYISGNNIVEGVIQAPNYISNINDTTQPYATVSSVLNTNLNADLLDSQHGNYYLDYNNLINKEYIGLQHSIAETDTINSGAVVKYEHFALADITINIGSIDYDLTNNAILIKSSGDYIITFSFQIRNSDDESLIKFQVMNGIAIVTERQISVLNNNYYLVTINTTVSLTAGSYISLQYSHGRLITESLILSNMNVFIEKK